MAFTFNPFTGNFDYYSSSSGTVTSITMTVPAFMTVTGSPITSSGTLAVTMNAASGNKFLASPNDGSSGTPAMRALVGADLPNPSSSTLGGIQSAAAQSNKWINSISTSGVPSLTQPAFSNISSSLAGSQLPTFTGDVTNSSAAMTIAAIQATAVSGTTGSGNVVFSANPTFTGSMIFGNAHVEPSFANAGSSGASITLDLSTASCIKTTLNNATPALTLINGQAGAAYRLMIVQDGTGSRVPSFVTTIDWGTLGAPTLSTGANKIDFLDLWTPDGSTFYGMAYSLGY